ncbi:hypothetical protein pb186bvf_007912 [Paramecium bursaria]
MMYSNNDYLFPLQQTFKNFIQIYLHKYDGNNIQRSSYHLKQTKRKIYLRKSLILILIFKL